MIHGWKRFSLFLLLEFLVCQRDPNFKFMNHQQEGRIKVHINSQKNAEDGKLKPWGSIVDLPGVGG